MKRLAVVTGCGALAFTALEWVLSVALYRGEVPFASTWRLATLAIALGSVYWLLLFVAGGIVQIAGPLVTRSRGWLLQRPPAVLAVLGAAAAFAVVWRGHIWANQTFHEAVLTSAIVSALAGGVAAALAALRQSRDAAPALPTLPSHAAYAAVNVPVDTSQRNDRIVPWLWSLLLIATATFVVTWRTDALMSDARWSGPRVGFAVAALASLVAVIGYALLPSLNAYMLTLGELLSP
ncbi:MAG: hypothetical protein KBG15_13395, partial [Kofleriaceae bacterium]|nr:hypothetical protein [Kofleriaceae bacterium]